MSLAIGQWEELVRSGSSRKNGVNVRMWRVCEAEGASNALLAECELP